MAEVPSFFVPGQTSDTIEEAYSGYAKWCSRSVAGPKERIYSIEFRHDGIEWVATVGQNMRGTARRVRRRGGKKVEETKAVSDQAQVLAIFAGSPFLVVTNAGITAGVRSAFVNPFMAGQPIHVVYFSEAK